ncbi:unnamed protein product, partial [Ectocarpus sp. 8 AP-2014]
LKELPARPVHRAPAAAAPVPPIHRGTPGVPLPEASRALHRWWVWIGACNIPTQTAGAASALAGRFYPHEVVRAGLAVVPRGCRAGVRGLCGNDGTDLTGGGE